MCVHVFVCIYMSVCVRVCVLMWSRPSIHFIAENEDDLELLVLLLCDGFACVGHNPSWLSVVLGTEPKASCMLGK